MSYSVLFQEGIYLCCISISYWYLYTYHLEKATSTLHCFRTPYAGCFPLDICWGFFFGWPRWFLVENGVPSFEREVDPIGDTPIFHWTVDGRNPAPVDMLNILLFTGFHTCWVVRDFFHQQYDDGRKGQLTGKSSLDFGFPTDVFAGFAEEDDRLSDLDWGTTLHAVLWKETGERYSKIFFVEGHFMT